MAIHPIFAKLLEPFAPKERRIITVFVYPPIPIRTMDWFAYYDGDEPNDNGQMLHGYGATEAEAIAELRQAAADRD